MQKHVVVNRLEIPHLTRDAYNSTLRCQASNTKLAPPVERTVRLDMLRKYIECFLIRKKCESECETDPNNLNRKLNLISY